MQANAFVESERALKTCVDDVNADGSEGGGAARCEGAVVFVNEIEKLPENVKPGSEYGNSVCVTRIVLFQGSQRAVQYCATESSAEGVK